MNEDLPPKQYQYEGDLARSYDHDRASDRKWKREGAILADFLDQIAADRLTVLDVPVGTGRFLHEYSKRCYKVIGVDVSDDMLNEARQRIAAEGLSSDEIRLERGNITGLELANGEVDVAVCIRLLNLVGLQTTRAALAELSRVSSGPVIVGVRTHGRRGTARRLAARLRSRLTGTTPKLTIHDELAVEDAIRKAGLSIIEKALVVTGPRKLSTYNILLLGHSDHAPGR